MFVGMLASVSKGKGKEGGRCVGFEIKLDSRKVSPCSHPDFVSRFNRRELTG